MVMLQRRISFSRFKSQQGSVTAELALALPAVSLVIAITPGAFALQIERMKLVDVAAMAARAIARGEAEDDVRRLISESVGSASSGEIEFELETRENLTCVILAQSFELPGLAGQLFELVENQCARKMGL